MSFNLFIHFVVYALLGKMLWRLILKKSAYPEFIPTRIKWMHAIILFYVLVSVWGAFFQFAWLLHYPAEIINCLTSQPNLLGQPSVGIALLLQTIVAFPLVFVCTKMAKREKKTLKWFSLLWPILLMSESYLAIIHDQGHIQKAAILMGTITSIVIGFAMIAFYLQRSSKILFEEQNPSLA